MIQTTPKRIISILLVICMTVALIPSVMAEEEESSVWQPSRMAELTDEEMENGVIYMGLNAGRAQERGTYSLTVYRDGNSENEAEIEISTIDLSAAIGEDYDVLVDDIEYYDTGGTVMERNANIDTEEMLEEYSNELQSVAENVSDESPKSAAEQGSVLAKLKEEQTGQKTRSLSHVTPVSRADFIDMMNETYGDDALTPEEYKADADMILDATRNNVTDFMAVSSAARLVFEPGETEKQVEIEIYEDEKPEDDEFIVFMLSSPEGALLGNLYTSTVTIEDDEPREEAFVGFKSEKQTVADGEPIILERTGADYYMVSVDAVLENGGRQTVYFKPYQTEAKLEMSIEGRGKETVTLENFTACSEGDITECEISFDDGKTEKTETVGLPGIQIASDGDDSSSTEGNSSFELKSSEGGVSAHLDGYNLRVDYVPGQKDSNSLVYGKIMDPSYVPEVWVGNYYFPESFTRGTTGDDGSENNYNDNDASKGDGHPNGYIYLGYYDWRIWREGTSYAELKKLDHEIYRGYAADWSGGRIHSVDAEDSMYKRYFSVYNSAGTTLQSFCETNSFDRRTDLLTALGTDGLPEGAGGSLKLNIADEESAFTPSPTINLYGVAAMFRTFNISLQQPGEMEFKDGDQTVKKKPCNVQLGTGHELRYTNQTLTITAKSAEESTGLMPGELIGYKIETNWRAPEEEKDKRDFFYYMASGHKPSEAKSASISDDNDSNTVYTTDKTKDLTNILFDEDFIKIIDQHLKGVSGSNSAKWSTDLQFTPLYIYKDVDVRIKETDLGTFNGLPAGDYKFHEGDTLRLSGVGADGYDVKYAGSRVAGRLTKNQNEETVFDVTINLTGNSTETVYTLGATLGGIRGCGYYEITPEFVVNEPNYISFEIQADEDGNAHGVADYLMFLSEEQIKTLMDEHPEYKLKGNENIYICNPNASGTTEAEKIINMITPVRGKVYSFNAECTDQRMRLRSNNKDGTNISVSAKPKYWAPVFENSFTYGTKKVYGTTAHIVASGEAKDNVVKLSSVEASRENDIFLRATGSITAKEHSIRESAEYMEVVGVPGLVVTGPGEVYTEAVKENAGTEQEIIRERSEFNTPSDTTANDGSFKLEGINLPEDAEAYTIYYTNGNIEGVYVVDITQLKSDIEAGKAVLINAKNKDGTDNADAITFNRNAERSDGGNLDVETKVDGYANAIAEDIQTPVITTDAPYPTSVEYKFEKSASTTQYGTVSNSVPIIDDCLTVTLTINPNGREVKKVKFVIDRTRTLKDDAQKDDDKKDDSQKDDSQKDDSQKDDSQKDDPQKDDSQKDDDKKDDVEQENDIVYEVDLKPGQTSVDFNFGSKSLKDVLEPGDKLYVIMVDAAKREVTTTGQDADGNPIPVTNQYDIEYTRLYTGLSFYVPMVNNVMQSFDFVPQQIGAKEVPVLGEWMGSMSTGVITFNHNSWTTGGIDGYSLTFDLNASPIGYPSVPATEKFKELKKTQKAAEDAARPDPAEAIDWSAYRGYKGTYRNSMTDVFGKNKFSVNFVVLANLDWVLDRDTGEYVFAGAQIALGLSGSFKKTIFGVMLGAPLFFDLNVDIAFEWEDNIVEDKKLTFDRFGTYQNIKDAFPNSNNGELLILGGKFQVGIGLCGVIGARGFIGVDAKLYFPNHGYEENRGHSVTLEGGIGIDLVFFSIEYVLGGRTWAGGIYADEASDSVSSASADEPILRTRAYNTGGGGRVGDPDNVSLADITSHKVLIEDAPEHTRPQIVTLNDGRKLMVYIGSDTEREYDINKACLYYSVYDGGKWSEAQPVENDGTPDSTPSLAKYGDKVVIAWSDASKAFDADLDAAIADGTATTRQKADLLSCNDISMAMFDGNTIHEATKVNDDERIYNGNGFWDFNPVICADPDGEDGMVLYYTKRDLGTVTDLDEELLDVNATYETIAAVAWDERGVSEEQFVPVDGDPLINEIDSELFEMTVGGETHNISLCAYMADKDGNLETYEDNDVYLLIFDVTADKVYGSINLTNDYDANIKPQLTRIRDRLGDKDGKDDIYYSWLTKYEKGNNTKTKLNVLSFDRLVSEVEAHFASNAGLEDPIEAELDDVVEYLKSPDARLPLDTINLSDDETVEHSFNEYKMFVGGDDNLYILWTDSNSEDQDDCSMELYGAVRYDGDGYTGIEGDAAENAMEDSGWSGVSKLTNFSDEMQANTVIDEFTAAVGADGDFTLLSNLFTQDLDEDGNMVYSPNELIEFTIDDSAKSEIDGESVQFDSEYPRAGEETAIEFDLKNTGLMKLKGYEATVKVGGETFGSVTSDHKILGGKSETVKVTGVLPENLTADTQVEITVTCPDNEPCTYSGKVPFGAKLGFETVDLEQDENENLVYTVDIKNTGNAESGNFNLEIQHVINGEGLVGAPTNVDTESIGVGETVRKTVTLNKETLEPLDFGTLGIAELSLKAMNGETEIDSDIENVSDYGFVQKFGLEYVDGKAVVTAPKKGTYSVIFAAYDENGMLISVDVSDVKFDDVGIKSVAPENFNTEGAARAEVMLWNSVDGMMPICDAVAIPLR